MSSLESLSRELSFYLRQSPEVIDIELFTGIMRCIVKLNILLHIHMRDESLPEEVQLLVSEVLVKVQTYDRQQLLVAKHLMDKFLLARYPDVID